jgi:hypothetical protein
LDSTADKAEAQVYVTLGDGSKVLEARVRREHMSRFWQNRVSKTVEQWVQYRREAEYTLGVGETKEQHDREEAQIAENLLRSYIAARVQAQVQGRIAEQNHRLLQSLSIG